jgi:hypothetical protein
MQHNPKLLVAASVAALLSLAACDNQPETITSGGNDPQADQLAKAKPVELPPAIAASRTYRCKDNSLIYVDFYTNNTANVRLGSREEMPTQLISAGEGQPYVAEGYSLSANAPSVTFASPGKASQSCNA